MTREERLLDFEKRWAAARDGTGPKLVIRGSVRKYPNSIEPESIEGLRETLAAIDAERKFFSGLIDDEMRKTLVFCEDSIHGNGCGAKLPVGSLIYIQTLWYERPYSCYEGDRWHHGEGNFNCPVCGNRNRLNLEREDISKLRKYFKETINEYDKY